MEKEKGSGGREQAWREAGRRREGTEVASSLPEESGGDWMPFPPQYPKFGAQPSHCSPVYSAGSFSRSPHTEKWLVLGWEWVMPGMGLGMGDTIGMQG